MTDFVDTSTAPIMVRSRRCSMARKRRAFSDEFKQQAVRRVRERTAIGVTLAQIGRELGVRPDLLRRWAQVAAARDGGAAASEEVVTRAEVPRLRRENEVLRQEAAFAKKAARSSRRNSGEREVRLHSHSPSGIPGRADVSRARGLDLGLLRVAAARTECARGP